MLLTVYTKNCYRTLKSSGISSAVFQTGTIHEPLSLIKNFTSILQVEISKIFVILTSIQSVPCLNVIFNRKTGNKKRRKGGREDQKEREKGGGKKKQRRSLLNGHLANVPAGNGLHQAGAAQEHHKVRWCVPVIQPWTESWVGG